MCKLHIFRKQEPNSIRALVWFVRVKKQNWMFSNYNNGSLNMIYSAKRLVKRVIILATMVLYSVTASATTINYNFDSGTLNPMFSVDGVEYFRISYDLSSGLTGKLDTATGTFQLAGTVSGVAQGALWSNVTGQTSTITIDQTFTGLTLENYNGEEFWVARAGSTSTGTISGSLMGLNFSFNIDQNFANVVQASGPALNNRYAEFVDTGDFATLLGNLGFNNDGRTYFESWITNTSPVALLGEEFDISGDSHSTVFEAEPVRTAETPEPSTVLLLSLALVGAGVLRKKNC